MDYLTNQNEELEFLNYQIDNGEKLQRLLENNDFVELFQDLYLTSWTETQRSMFAKASPDSRRKITEGLLARSVFDNFIDEIKSDAMEAKNSIVEINEMIEREDDDNMEQ